MSRRADRRADRQAAAASAPRRRRLRVRPIVWGVVAYLGVVALLTLLGVKPSPLLLAAFFIALGSLVAYVDGRWGDTESVSWPVPAPSQRGIGRGSDHRTAARARRLAGAAGSTAGARLHLATEIHTDLVAAIASTTQRSHGLDPRVDPRALGLLPPELADLVRQPPSASLLDPTTLTHLLDRIESL